MLLHGGGQTRLSWAGAQREFISRGCRVLAYDARGHGESDWAADGDYGLAALAGDLKAVLTGEEGSSALVGASLGGATSMQAVADALRPQALVLVDIALRPDRTGVERIRRFMQGAPDGFASLDEAAEAVAAYNPHRSRASEHSGLLKNLRLAEDGRYHWRWDPAILAPPPDGALAEFEATVAELKAAPALPLALVHGSQSDVVNDEGVADLAAAIPSLEVLVVEGAGHMVAGDRNDAFNAGVIAFLQAHMPPLPAPAAAAA